jgi:hypothetical protein
MTASTPGPTSPKQTPPRRLTLEESEGCVRVIFAVPPKWVCIVEIVIPAVTGVAILVVGIAIVRLLWLMLNELGPPPPDLVADFRRVCVRATLCFGIPSLAYCGAAIFNWWTYRRWGRVPRVLAADNAGLALSRLAFWKMREQKWPASEITAIELRPVRGNLNWTRTVADLCIRRRQGRRLRFRLSSADSQLPGRIASRLSAMLCCPLVQSVK